MNDEKYKEEMLEQIRGTNINLVELQHQQDITNERLDHIERNVGCLTFIVITGVIIIILVFIGKLSAINELINLLHSLQTYPY